jgi:hypothetical protein
MPWKAVSLDVELDLAEKGEKEPRWQPVRLSFVRDVKEPGEAQVSKKDWALFLTTNIELSMSNMLETYALRWGYRGIFQGSETASGFPPGADGNLCIAYRINTPVCDSPWARGREHTGH